MALRLLLDQPSKTLGTLLGVVISTFLMAQQMATFLGILGRVTAFADGTDVDVWVASPTTENTDITDTVPMTYVALAASTEGVAFAAPVVQGMSRASRPDGVRELVKVIGIELPRKLGLARNLVGTQSSDLNGPSRVFLNVADRPLYGLVERGERLEIAERTLIVAGFYEGLEPHASYGYVFVPLPDARAILGFPEQRASFVAVRAIAGRDAATIAERIRSRIPDARVFTSAELATAESAHFLERTPVGLVFGMGTIVAALVGTLIVGLTMYSSVTDRTRDFGTLIAVGATRRDLLALIFGQALAFFVVGTALGLFVFGVVKMHATSAPMLAPPRMLAHVAFVSLISCLLASLVAVRRVLGIDPAIVFKG